VQLDFAMPDKFDLEYTGADGNLHRPVVIHRVVYGSIERFFGILVEHFAGAFPVWLAPVQAVVVPVAQAFEDYAVDVRDRLRASGIRAEADLSNETLKYKIRAAQTDKTPYMLVVGERERDGDAVSVRHRKHGDVGSQTVDAFIARVSDEIASRSLDAESV